MTILPLHRKLTSHVSHKPISHANEEVVLGIRNDAVTTQCHRNSSYLADLPRWLYSFYGSILIECDALLGIMDFQGRTGHSGGGGRVNSTNIGPDFGVNKLNFI